MQECEVLVFRIGTKLKIRFDRGWDSGRNRGVKFALAVLSHSPFQLEMACRLLHLRPNVSLWRLLLIGSDYPIHLYTKHTYKKVVTKHRCLFMHLEMSVHPALCHQAPPIDFANHRSNSQSQRDLETPFDHDSQQPGP